MHAATPTWITLYLDVDPASSDAGIAFWRAVTGYGLSAARGEDGEFATLVPPAGDAHLRVQWLRSGPSRLHLDVHVVDIPAAVPAAERLGARVVTRWPKGGGFVLLASPGGLPFCLVPSLETRPVEPAAWPGGRSVVDQACLDVPPRLYDAEFAFWRDLTGYAATPPGEGNEFGVLHRPADRPVRILLQRLDDDQEAVTAHLDLAAEDRDAEVARHEGLGARVLRRTAEWTVLADPTGRIYCVTDRDPETGVSEPR